MVHSGRKKVKGTGIRKEQHVVIRAEKVAIGSKIITVVGAEARHLSEDI